MFENIPFALNYKNILLKHGKCVVNSRSDCDISSEIAGKAISCPVIPSNMPAIVDIEICKLFDSLGWFHVYPRLGGFDDQKKYIAKANSEAWNFVSISIGIKEEDNQLLDFIIDSNFRVDAITLDVAFSYTDRIIPFVEKIKDKIECYLIVGNGNTPEWIQWLEKMGVDCAKIGIGVSSACKTRQYTGFGSTTVSDLATCAVAANKIRIMADGGLTIGNDGDVWIGDCAKAIKFGASYVMSGSLFSLCSDSPAQITGYFGNSTEIAKGHPHHIEGTIVKVKNSGLTIKEKVKRIEDSLKSSVSYAGGNKLEDLRYCEFEIVL